MGEHRRNHGDRQELGGDRARGEDPGRSVVYDRRRDGDNIERDRPGSGSGSVANISKRSGSFNTACEASATEMTGHGSPRYGGEGGKEGKGQDELAAARAALAEAAKAAAARVAGATDENRRWERFVALLE